MFWKYDSKALGYPLWGPSSCLSFPLRVCGDNRLLHGSSIPGVMPIITKLQVLCCKKGVPSKNKSLKLQILKALEPEGDNHFVLHWKCCFYGKKLILPLCVQLV